MGKCESAVGHSGHYRNNHKARVVEYLQFDFDLRSRTPNGGRVFRFRRNYTLDDGPVVVSKQPWVGLSVNSVDVPVASELRDDSKGATLWVYIPGEGRFILSLAPHEGIAALGTVRGRRMSFSVEGRNYEVWLGKPLVSGEGPWNLYVMHQPQFVLAGSRQPVARIGVDRLENLVPGR